MPDLTELRGQAIRSLAVFVLLLAGIFEAALEFTSLVSFRAISTSVIALIGAGLLTLWLLRRGIRRAGGALVGLLILTCIGEAWITASVLPLYALPVVIVVAGLSLGAAIGSACAAVAVLASAGVLWGIAPVSGAPGPMSIIDALWPLLLIAITPMVIWLTGRPVQATVAWAWVNYAQTIKLTKQLREHQGELAEALRNVRIAYEQLARTSTELAHARAAADEARQLKTEFAANISHELRTPLNLIIGFSELMLFGALPGDDPLNRTQRGDVEAIHRNAQHLSELINDVLELGEIDAGHMGLHKSQCRLAEVVEEAKEIVTNLFEGRGLTIITEIPSGLPPVYADQTRIRQVLINLFNNAARFTDRGGAWVSASHDGRDLTVTVRDSGIGISQRDLPHVFEEFHQFDAALQRGVGGSGLGLTICKKIIELHGGNIQVESVVGQGTAFTFTLPLRDAVMGTPLRAPWETWARSPAPVDEEGALILVASHDPGSIRVLQRHLQIGRVVGTEPATLQHDLAGARAIIRILDQRDDLATALQEFTQLDPQLPVLFCRMPSGRDLREDLRVTDYLVKPFSREDLLAAVNRIPGPIETVLIVDDDAAMVEMIARMLTSGERKIAIRRASNGADALAMLNRPESPIDLLILDLIMPQLDGRAVLEAIHTTARLAHLPIIVVSARGFIDHGVASSLLAVSRGRGLSIRDLAALIESCIPALDGRSTPAPEREALDRELTSRTQSS